MFLILLLVASVSAFTSTGSIWDTPGVSTRCNRTESCLPFSSREQFSIDWLCCEDKNGWVAAHFLLPFGTYLFTHSITLTMLQVLFSEYIEATGLLLGSNTIFTVDDNTPLETWTGSLVGDGTIGFAAIGVAALLIYVFDAPPLIHDAMMGGVHRKYFFLWAGYSSLFLLHLWTTGPESTLNPGAIVSGVAGSLYLALFMPWVTTRAKSDWKLVWRRNRRSRRWTRGRIRGFFAAWTAVVVVCDVQTVGLEYLANDWFQVGLSILLVTAVLAVAALIKRSTSS